jgi:hypothetical protein
MDYNELELEFERIFSQPLWQRPIEVAMLAKIHGIPTPDLRKAFCLFSGRKYQERRNEN